MLLVRWEGYSSHLFLRRHRRTVRDVKVFRAEDLEGLRRSITERVHEIVEEAMQVEVADVVTEVMRGSIIETVYNAYEPHPRSGYQRRKDDWGLMDRRNVVMELTGRRQRNRSKELTVWNMAKRNPFNNLGQVFSMNKKHPEDETLLQHIIIKGWRNAGAGSPAYKQPRPFMARANEDLRLETVWKRVEDAFFDGLTENTGLERV